VGGAVRPRPDPSLRVRCMGLDFDSPLGMAAGFDKGEVLVRGLHALGFSHVEVGTITPRPQAGNVRPRLFRLPEHQALVNRMGFNNQGVEACGERLSRLPREGRGIVGVNVGKNKDTPNERAVDDYLAAIDGLHSWADYLVVNLSSPNTPGLRELQERAPLERLLGACVDRARPLGKPLLVKLAPDLSPEALDEAVDVAVGCGASGGRGRAPPGEGSGGALGGATGTARARLDAQGVCPRGGSDPDHRGGRNHGRGRCLHPDPGRGVARAGLHGARLRGARDAAPLAGGASRAHETGWLRLDRGGRRVRWGRRLTRESIAC
jgi:hypothetical protein